MQQAASQQFSFTARKTMAIAQQLYEGLESNGDESVGLITYMRTDSTQVSDQAINEVRSAIKQFFGDEYLPKSAARYSSKARRAQEAHEAVRPTSVFRTPEKLKGRLTRDQYRLYDLIWRRFVASQMNPALYDTLRVEVEGQSDLHTYLFRVSTSTLRFPGFMKVYGQGNGNGKNAEEDGEREGVVLPDLVVGDELTLINLYPEQHFTQPPPRFSDASLIREMEEFGIGRPSTYAPIISTLRRRGYVIREQRRLVPTEIGMTVNDLLVDHFPYVVDVNFTADLESELDEVASGEREWVDVVRHFYDPFSEQLEKAEEEMPEVKAEPEMLDRMCPECGSPLLIRHGRYGKFIGCSNFPECRHTEPFLEKIGVSCPLDGGDIVRRKTRKGRVFYGCSNYPECEFTSWKEPLPVPCPNCGSLLVSQNRDEAKCTECENVYKKSELEIEEPDLA
jgi:DNA topoisomerase-1